MTELTVQDFSDHAQLFGVKDAALMFRNEGKSLVETLTYLQAATLAEGLRVRFRAADDGFDWLAVREPAHWTSITKINSPYHEQVDTNFNPPRYRHRAMTRIKRDGWLCLWYVPGEWIAGPAPMVRK